MNKPKAKLLKISIAVLVIFTLVSVLVVWAASVDGWWDIPSGEWLGGVPSLDTPGDAPPDVDIIATFAEYGSANAWFRVDVGGPPPYAGASGVAEIMIFIDNLPGQGCSDLRHYDPNPRYDALIDAVSFGSNAPWAITDVFNCDGAGSWNWVGNAGTTVSGAGGSPQDIVEIETPLSLLQMPPYPMSYFVVYDSDHGTDFAPGAPPPQTLVELASFSAAAGEDGVLVEWETASEIDNAGFNVYRADSADGEYVKLNDGLIAAQGDPTQGAAYSFLDAGSDGGTYKLEDVDTGGVSTFHGPVSAEGGDPTSVGLVSMKASSPMVLLVIPLLAPLVGLTAGGLALLRRRRRL